MAQDWFANPPATPVPAAPADPQDYPPQAPYVPPQPAATSRDRRRQKPPPKPAPTSDWFAALPEPPAPKLFGGAPIPGIKPTGLTLGQSMVPGTTGLQVGRSGRLTPTDVANVQAGYRSPYASPAKEIQARYGIPDNIYLGLISWESSWNPKAVSPKGAIGLTQVMPATARGMGIDPKTLSNDPQMQLELGAQILRNNYNLIKKNFPGLTEQEAWNKALQAYNAGPGTVLSGKPLPKETLNYVGGVRNRAEAFGPGTPSGLAKPPSPPQWLQSAASWAGEIGKSVQAGYEQAKTDIANAPPFRYAGDALRSPQAAAIANVWAQRPLANIRPFAIDAAQMIGTQPGPGEIAINPKTGDIITAPALQRAATPVSVVVQMFPSAIEFPAAAKLMLDRGTVEGLAGVEAAHAARDASEAIVMRQGEGGRWEMAPTTGRALVRLEAAQSAREHVREAVAMNVPGARIQAEAEANTARGTVTPATVAAEHAQTNTAAPLPGNTFTTQAAAKWWNIDEQTAAQRLTVMEANGTVRQGEGGLWEMRTGPAAAAPAAAEWSGRAGTYTGFRSGIPGAPSRFAPGGIYIAQDESYARAFASRPSDTVSRVSVNVRNPLNITDMNSARILARIQAVGFRPEFQTAESIDEEARAILDHGVPGLLTDERDALKALGYDALIVPHEIPGKGPVMLYFGDESAQFTPLGRAAPTAEQVAQNVAEAQAGSRQAGAPLTIEVPSMPQAAAAVREAMGGGETGALNLGAFADYLDNANRVLTVTGDIEEKMAQMEGHQVTVALKADKALAAADKVSAADKEAIMYALEDPTEPLTPAQQRAYRVLRAIRDETQAKKLATRDDWPMVTDIGYVRRFIVKGRDLLDRMVQGGRRFSVGGRMRTTTASMKHRQMVMLTDEATGDEIVAHVAPGGEVTGFRDGVVVPLGRFTLKSKEQLLEGEIKPLQRKIDLAEKQIRTLQGLRLNPQRVAAMERRLSVLSSELMNLGRTNTPQDIRAIEREIAKIQDAIRVAKGGGAIERRVEALQRGIADLRRQADIVLARYDPHSLNDEVLIAGDRRYMVGSALIKDIEAATGGRITYYKDPFASVLLDHLEANRVFQANKFIEGLMADPGFGELAAPARSAGAKAGWVPTRFPKFRGWVMEPRVAAELDRLTGQLEAGRPIPEIVEQANRFLTTTMFIGPGGLGHVRNVGVNWAFDRGLTPWFNLPSYVRLVKASTRAINAAFTVNKDYTDMLDAGAGLQRMRGAEREVIEKIVSKAREEIQENPRVLAGLSEGLGVPLQRLADLLSKPSHYVAWLTQDIATLERIYERELEGMTREDAVRETSKWIPTYRLPATILGQPAISQFLSNRNVVIFAPYHYGLLKSYGQAARIVFSTAPLAERARIADKLAMLGVMDLVYNRFLDAYARQLTGNRRATVGRSGQLSIPTSIYRATQGDIPPLYAAESIVSPSPILSVGIAELTRMDEWSDPNLTWAQKAGKFVSIGAPQLGPMQTRAALQGQGLDPGKIAFSTVGVNIPKRGPHERKLATLVYDSPKNMMPDVYRLVYQHKDAEAHRRIRAYNTSLYREFLGAQWEQGQKPNPKEAREYLKKHGKRVPSYNEAVQWVKSHETPPRLGAPTPGRGGLFGGGGGRRGVFGAPLEVDTAP